MPACVLTSAWMRTPIDDEMAAASRVRVTQVPPVESEYEPLASTALEAGS